MVITCPHGMTIDFGLTLDREKVQDLMSACPRCERDFRAHSASWTDRHDPADAVDEPPARLIDDPGWVLARYIEAKSLIVDMRERADDFGGSGDGSLMPSEWRDRVEEFYTETALDTCTTLGPDCGCNGPLDDPIADVMTAGPRYNRDPLAEPVRDTTFGPEHSYDGGYTGEAAREAPVELTEEEHWALQRQVAEAQWRDVEPVDVEPVDVARLERERDAWREEAELLAQGIAGGKAGEALAAYAAFKDDLRGNE